MTGRMQCAAANNAHWRDLIPRIILARHGETDWNVERRSQGWNDQPLNEHGLKQAALLGGHVRARFDIRQAWSSDLTRCTQTAEAIGLPYQTARGLRELHFGQWEGRLWPELHREAPELAAKFVRGDPSFQAPGGERLGDLVVRAGRFIEETGLTSGDGDVLVISHGGMLRSLIVALLGLPADSVGRFSCNNCSVSIVTAVPGLVRLESLNDTAHLNGT